MQRPRLRRLPGFLYSALLLIHGVQTVGGRSSQKETLGVPNHERGRIRPFLPVLVLFALAEVQMDSGASKGVSDG